jgi:hypothetical protein
VQEDTRENVLAQKSANARAHRKIDLLRQSLNESMEASKSECVAGRIPLGPAVANVAQV